MAASEFLRGVVRLTAHFNPMHAKTASLRGALEGGTRPWPVRAEGVRDSGRPSPKGVSSFDGIRGSAFGPGPFRHSDRLCPPPSFSG